MMFFTIIPAIMYAYILYIFSHETVQAARDLDYLPISTVSSMLVSSIFHKFSSQYHSVCHRIMR